MMELWPFTNFHDLNLDWIIKTVLDWVKKMQNFITQMTSDWKDMRDDWTDYQNDLNAQWQEFINDTYQEQITEILEQHPEWVTTVMDGAITKPKINAAFLKEIENVYAIPDTYGAVGDGVTDDTQAFVDALTAHDILLIPPEKTYKISTLNLSHGKHILGDGTILVDGGGFVFNCPTESKSFRNIKFETDDSPCITTTGLSDDTAHGTLDVLNVTFTATDNTTQALHIGADTDANVDGCVFKSCGMDNVDSINTNVTNCTFEGGYYGIYYANTNNAAGRDAYACGMRVSDTTIIGCTIGVKTVQCDSMQIDNCMIDYEDYPVIILGTSSVDITNSFITSRQGNEAVHIASNNSSTGVFGGNGFSTELANDIRIDNCTIYQHSEALDNPTIYVKNSQWCYITNISISYAGKAGIELHDTGNVIVQNVRINSRVSGSMGLLSFVGNALEDTSSFVYRNIITALPVFVHYADAERAGSTYSKTARGTKILAADETDVTITTGIPSGINYAFLTTSAPLTINYYETDDRLRLITGSHSGPIRVNWLVYAKPNNTKFTLNGDGSVTYTP